MTNNPTPEQTGEWLVAQLRAWPDRVHEERTTNIRYLMTAAADRIEADARRIAELETMVNDYAAQLVTRLKETMNLREALKPFADACMHLHPGHPDDGETMDGFTVAQFRQAYTAYHAPALSAEAIAGEG